MWNEDGSEVFTDAASAPDWTRRAIIRVSRDINGWKVPELLIRNNFAVQVVGVKAKSDLMSRLISFRWTDREIRRNGKLGQSRTGFAIIDPDMCTDSECVPSDGIQLPESPHSSYSPGLWTRDGGMLFPDYIGNDLFIKKYLDPLTGEESTFSPLGPIDTLSEKDTSF